MLGERVDVATVNLQVLELRLIGERKDQIDRLFSHLKVCPVIETVTVQKWYIWVL